MLCFLWNLRSIIIKAHLYFQQITYFTGFYYLLSSQKIAVKSSVLVALNHNAFFPSNRKKFFRLCPCLAKWFVADNVLAGKNDLFCHNIVRR